MPIAPSASHRARAKYAGHIREKAPFFLAMRGIRRHIGGEVMHLPIGRDREMERIERAIDDHDAIFARHAVGAARVEIIDRQQFIARQLIDGGGEVFAPFDPDKMPAGVEARRTQQ